MTEKDFKKLAATARAGGMSAVRFSQMLCAPPHNLTPPEATPLMRLYTLDFAPKPVKQLPKPKLAASPALRDKSLDHPDVGAGVEPATVVESAPRQSIINRSAVKAYALKVSRENRAGKFTRVSAEFLDSVEANLDALIRNLAQGFATTEDSVEPDKENDWFVNGRTLRCAEDKLNQAARLIVLGKVRRHPSVGVTLK